MAWGEGAQVMMMMMMMIMIDDNDDNDVDAQAGPRPPSHRRHHGWEPEIRSSGKLNALSLLSSMPSLLFL